MPEASYVGRRREGEDLAGRRHRSSRPHRGPGPAPGRRAAAARGRSRSRRSSGSAGVGSNFLSRSATGSARTMPRQLRVVGPLQPRRPELPREVADDGADRRLAILAVGLAVLIPARDGEPAAVAIHDRAARRASRRGDDSRVVGRGRQALRLDHLPVPGTGGEDRERDRQRDAGPPDVPGDGRAVALHGTRAMRPGGRRFADHATEPRCRAFAGVPLRLTRRIARRSRSRGPRRRRGLHAAVGQRQQQPDDDRVREQRRAAVAR